MLIKNNSRKKYDKRISHHCIRVLSKAWFPFICPLGLKLWWKGVIVPFQSPKRLLPKIICTETAHSLSVISCFTLSMLYINICSAEIKRTLCFSVALNQKVETAIGFISKPVPHKKGKNSLQSLMNMSDGIFGRTVLPRLQSWKQDTFLCPVLQIHVIYETAVKDDLLRAAVFSIPRFWYATLTISLLEDHQRQMLPPD